MPNGRGIDIEYGTKFLRNLKKLPIKLQRLAGDRETIFKHSPFDPKLKTHKLHGKDAGSWAYSVDNCYRIKFIFTASMQILYLDIGTHDIYE